jgi:hypothetical protein
LYGNQDGSGLVRVGKNETGSYGSSDGWNWSVPESFNFNMDDQQSLFVATWSDNSVAQGWIGQFATANQTILSNTSDWLWKPTNQDYNDGSVGPNEANIALNIGTGSWNTIPNAGYPLK